MDFLLVRTLLRSTRLIMPKQKKLFKNGPQEFLDQQFSDGKENV